jgi:hypothetical protein
MHAFTLKDGHRLPHGPDTICQGFSHSSGNNFQNDEPQRQLTFQADANRVAGRITEGIEKSQNRVNSSE